MPKFVWWIKFGAMWMWYNKAGECIVWLSSICSLDFIDFIACGCFGARKQAMNQFQEIKLQIESSIQT